MAALDIKIDDPFNELGDFNIKDCDYQNVHAIFYTQKGQFYQWPTLGVGIVNFINSPDDLIFLRSTIIEELAKDSYELINYEALISIEGELSISLDAQRII